MIKFVDDEYMGPHGDYGGRKSDDFFMMRLSLGIGESVRLYMRR
jgi:hypothetical protein